MLICTTKKTPLVRVRVFASSCYNKNPVFKFAPRLEHQRTLMIRFTVASLTANFEKKNLQSIDKKCCLNVFIKYLCFYIQRINYRLALFCLDQASLLLKYEFRAEALDFPLVTRHKKESFL